MIDCRGDVDPFPRTHSIQHPQPDVNANAITTRGWRFLLGRPATAHNRAASTLNTGMRCVRECHSGVAPGGWQMGHPHYGRVPPRLGIQH